MRVDVDPPRDGEKLVVARARGCVGARFRLHGRVPDWGLDCVGVAAVAFGRAVAGDYPLRWDDAAAVVARIDAAGLRRATGREAGALLLLRAGPGQLHLAIRTDTGFVHADARLRRVVEVPGAPPWPVIASWTGEE